jgi:hypothetical protein
VTYRAAPVPERVRQLTALLATESALREERAVARRRHDELCEEADRLGRELAEAERDLEEGLVATIKGWFGRPREEIEAAVASLRERLVTVTTRIEAEVAIERDLTSRLDAIGVARAELDVLHAAAITRLAAAEGPVGDELRGLGAGIAAATTQLELLECTALAAGQAEYQMQQIMEQARMLNEVSGALDVMTGLVEAVDTLTGGGAPSAPSDRVIVRARLREACVQAQDRLRAVATNLERLQAQQPTLAARLPASRFDAAATTRLADPIEKSALVVGAPDLAQRLGALATALGGARREISDGRAELEQRRRELALRAT